MSQLEPAYVVNVKHSSFDLYIGRKNSSYGLPESKWANPFQIGKHGDRASVLEQYEAYLLGNAELMASLPELSGKVLGCWCAGKGEHLAAGNVIVCHGQILLQQLQHFQQHIPAAPAQSSTDDRRLQQNPALDGSKPTNPPKSLSAWYLTAYPQFLEGFPVLPTPPFELRQGVRVLGGAFYDRLAFEVRRVQAAGTSPRFYTGALQRDLRDLYRLTVESSKPKLKLSTLQEWELENLDSEVAV